jgi:hypothetical protein
MDETGCRLRRLACGPHGAVDCCSHGTLHLRLGALSVQLTAAQLTSLADTLGEAARCLAAHGRRPQSH